MMSKGPRRRFTTEFKQQAVARLSMTGATQAGVAQELGITSSQLKAWRLELEAAGSVEAVRRQKAEAGPAPDDAHGSQGSNWPKRS